MFLNNQDSEAGGNFDASECSYRSSQVETNHELDEFASASSFFNQIPKEVSNHNFETQIENVGNGNDFSGIESQISMGFIGSGALIHNDGFKNSQQNGAISPKVMHASVKPSDLFQS